MREVCSIKIAVTCPTGIGTSKMLISRLQKEFPIFEVVCVVSIVDIDTNKLLNDDVKFIISTVNLNIDYPYVKVSPMLSIDDKKVLKQLKSELITFREKDVVDTTSKKDESQIDNKELSLTDIKYISEFGLEIINLTNSIFFYKSDVMDSKYEMISKLASLIGQTKEAIIDISTQLTNREKIASTYIKDLKLYLFHSKAKSVSHSKLGFIIVFGSA